MSRRGERRPVKAILAVLVVLAGATGCGGTGSATAERGGLSVAELLGGGEADSGFARALEPRPFAFPRDHGPHPDFRNEWWYITGNLAAGERRFGYQITLFRSALPRAAESRDSAWAADQLFMGHFALTDVDAERFHHEERFSRDGLALAGARADPLRVWLEDWTIEALAAEPDGRIDLRVRARTDAATIDLRLDAAKPPVLNGDAGLSRKGGRPGSASYYYSLTRMRTVGTVRAGDAEIAVEGDSWLDREWSTAALEEGQVGWDWMGLQLGDGRELMLYRLRRTDGTVDPASSGTFVDRGGRSRHLRRDDFEITATASWRSPRTGLEYPVRWTVRVPAHDLVLEVTPLLTDQEIDSAVRYWEGAVRVESAGGAAAGFGYVELTGYDTPASGSS